jgi:hypothetical protein
MKSLLAFFAVIMIALFISATKDTCTEINKSIKTGDVQQLSKYFAPYIEMSVLGKEGYFSKVQAVSILSEFFKNNPPRDFTVKHGGSSSENTKFSIGTYTASDGIFKIYYVLKKEKDNEFVQKLTIDEK